MINKELLSEVLGFPIDYINNQNEHCLGWHDEQGGHLVNIHELAHKCKEWARDNKYRLQGWYRTGKSRKYVIRIHNHIKELFEGIYDSEPEAVFAACQWILDNKDK